MSEVQFKVGTSGGFHLAVLVVDDERHIRTTLALYLESLGCAVTAASSAEQALAAAVHRPFDLAFVDVRLGDASGVDLLPKLLAERPSLSAVMLTAYATVESAVEAVKRGAADYLQKPFKPEQIAHVVSRCVEYRAAQQRLASLQDELKQSVPDVELNFYSPKMRAVLEVIERAAASDAAVLFHGENGTGKTVLARTLHRQSPRREQAFAVVNCPTLSEELLASELFGHIKGAFTGAVRDQPGRVEGAEGGTLFLDEVGEIAPSIQAKLLRFLQEKHYERVGESTTRRADVRVVAATNRNLEADVAAGRFREDLLYRLNVVEVHVPPLRDRREDILPLAEAFLAFFARSQGQLLPELSPATREVLLNYQWPGNVRELRNAMERTLILWPARVIEPPALPERMLTGIAARPAIGGDYTLEEIEREHVLAVMARKATAEDAAATLGINVSTLWRKRKRYEES